MALLGGLKSDPPELAFDHLSACATIYAAFGFACSRLSHARSNLRYPQLAIAAIGCIICGSLALSWQVGAASGSPSFAPGEKVSPPEPPPLLLRALDETSAISLNAKIPFSATPNVAAKPFRWQGSDEARGRAAECLTLAIYYEAASEDQSGEEAVAQVVLNRVRHPAFPASVCAVVFQGSDRSTGCQFSFTCDGSLTGDRNQEAWVRSRRIAEAALDGFVFKPVGLATHYHANYVVPYWATSLAKSAQIGVHIFYRWPGPWGEPGAFRRTYSGIELDPAELEMAAADRNRMHALSTAQPSELLRVVVDPRVELLGVVQLLATQGITPHDGESQYEQDVKAYFGPEANHPAVQLFKALAAKDDTFARKALAGALNSPTLDLPLTPASPPYTSSDGQSEQVEGLMYGLADFARQSDFMRFFSGHQPYYRKLTRSTEPAAVAISRWQTYTGLPVGVQRVIVSSLVGSGNGGDCNSTVDVNSPVRSWTILASANSVDAFLAVRSDPLQLTSPSRRRADAEDAAVEEQIVKAVFARVTALTSDASTGRNAVGQVAEADHTLVSTFERRLQYFETHRTRFPTLADFLPRLKAAAATFAVTSKEAGEAKDGQDVKVGASQDSAPPEATQCGRISQA